MSESNPRQHPTAPDHTGTPDQPHTHALTPLPTPADTIPVCTLALLAIGVVMVASAGMSLDPDNPVNPRTILTSSSTRYALLALAALLIARALPLRDMLTTRVTAALVPFLFPLAIAAMLLVHIPALRHEMNGAARWVLVPGLNLTFQPSEIAKWTLPLVIAWYAAKRPAAMKRLSTGILIPLAATSVVAAIIAHQDLGTAALVFAAATITIIAAGARIAHIALVVAPFAIAATTLGVLAEEYRIKRVLTFLNPYEQPEGAGYHMIQSLVAVASGDGTGKGLGFGIQKFGYLPEDRTDFLFAIIAEELGLAGVATVLILYAVLLLACLTVIRKEQHALPKLAAIGITATIGLQALINLFVVTAMAPTKGIALPLLSAGGTGWILTAACLGLIASIDRANNTKHRQTHAETPAPHPRELAPHRAHA